MKITNFIPIILLCIIFSISAYADCTYEDFLCTQPIFNESFSCGGDTLSPSVSASVWTDFPEIVPPESDISVLTGIDGNLSTYSYNPQDEWNHYIYINYSNTAEMTFIGWYVDLEENVSTPVNISICKGPIYQFQIVFGLDGSIYAYCLDNTDTMTDLGVPFSFQTPEFRPRGIYEQRAEWNYTRETCTTDACTSSCTDSSSFVCVIVNLFNTGLTGIANSSWPLASTLFSICGIVPMLILIGFLILTITFFAWLTRYETWQFISQKIRKK